MGASEQLGDTAIRSGRSLVLCILNLVFLSPLLSAKESEEEAEILLAPAATGSPRETLETFLMETESLHQIFENVVEGGDRPGEAYWKVQRALGVFDFSQVPDFIREQKSKEIALKMREILDRIDLPRLRDVPGPGEGDLPSFYTIPGTSIQIARVAEGPNEGEYLFSADTVDSVDKWFERVKSLPYKEGALEGFYDNLRHFPKYNWMLRLVVEYPALQEVWLGMALWQWLGFVGSILLTILALFVIFALGRASRRIDPSRHKIGLLVSSIFPLLSLCVAYLFKGFVNSGLSIYGDLLRISNFVASCLFVLVSLFVVWAVGFRIVEVLAEVASRSKTQINSLVVRLFGRLTIIFAAFVVLVEAGNSFGIPMTTLLAGAGVGGLALALGAQVAVRNLVGSMMILLDEPYKQGERIIAKGFDGVVEDIGIRSTKLRLLTGHQVSVPNETMAQAELENISRRPYIRKLFLLYLPLDTSSADLASALKVVRDCLSGHECQDEEFPPRAFIGDFARDGIEIKALVWYHPPDYWGFQDWMEKTTMKILKGLEDAGIRLIPPARWIEPGMLEEKRASE